MQYQVLVEKLPDGLFSAFVIGVPDVVAEGATVEDALNKAKTLLRERLATSRLFTIEVEEAPAGVGALVRRTTPRLGRWLAPFSHIVVSYSTFVAIHQVVPPASLTPPRLSSSCFLTGSCTETAPASMAFRYVASTSWT